MPEQGKCLIFEITIRCHEINFHDINSHEVNSPGISHEINFSLDQLPSDQLKEITLYRQLYNKLFTVQFDT